MKKTKKIISLLLSVLMIITALPLTAVNSFAETSDDYKYTILSDGTAEIKKYTGSATEIEIPSEIDGYNVTSIGERAFGERISLTSLIIPNGVTGIGKSAFSGCTSLISITIPDSVTSIGEWAFCGCTSLTSLIIPNGVTGIGKLAFSGCTSLISITIPDSVTSIGYSAFSNCRLLTSVTIPDSVTNIGYEAFYNTAYYNNKSNWDNGILYIGNHLIKAKNDISGSVEIKQGTKTIADNTFSYCRQLTNITIPDSVTSIGERAFCGCTSLTSITIPDSMTSIGKIAFDDCTSLTAISVNSENANYSSENGVLFNKDKTKLICYPVGKKDSSYSIPNSVTSIGDNAFSYCSSLTSITIPDSVTSIESYAFYNCESLTDITIPDSVTSIGYRTFSSCSSLVSVAIPNSVTSIGEEAFDFCRLLKGITIPNSVISIGERAFCCCTSLASVTIGNGVTSIASSAFDSCTSLTAISVNSENANYSSENGVLFNKDKTEIVRYLQGKKDLSYSIPDSVTSIGDNAFSYCSSLTSITIPDSVTSIGEWAFICCRQLTNITIPDSVTSIESYAFYNCESLTNITIPDSVTSIGSVAFADCTSLTKITIPDSVTSIPDNAFCRCTSLTSITISNSVTSIGGYAFSGCTSLTNITIPNSVISIGYSAFSNCRLLTSVTIPDSVTNIGYEAFYNTAYYNNKSNWDNGILYIGNHLIKAKNDISGSTEIEQGTKTIAGSAFDGCTSLISITIPDSVTGIGERAFGGCTSLTNITIPDSVTSIDNDAFGGTAYYNDESNWDNGILYIGNHLIKAKRDISGSVEIKQGTKTIASLAFYYCSSLTSITIPDSVIRIGRYAFFGCTSLTNITIPNSVTEIENRALGYYDNDSKYVSIYGFTIYGISGTAAERYAKNNSFNFVDIREPESITVSKSPAKTTYFIGDTLDTTGLELIATYSNGDTETVTSGYTVSGFDSETAGTKTVTVDYKGKTATFTVEVVKPRITIANNSLSFDSIGSTKSLTATTTPSDQKITWTSSNTSVATVSDDGVVTAKGDGNATITAKFTYNNIEYTATCNVTVKVPTVPTVTFPDVASGEWYYNAIKFNVDRGYFHGYGNGNFGPGNNIQRQDFVVVLSKIAGADLSAYAGQNGGFSDVPTNDYYSAAVAWAKDNHILSGYANGKFGVGDPITREQACVIFYNYCNGYINSSSVSSTLSNYPDGRNVSDWARPAVAWAAQNNVVGGNGKLNPAGNANRAEMAQIIMNMSNNGIL